MKIYNSKNKKKEDFKPLKDDEISMYVCGPTVYDVGHLGHGRSAVAFDVIRRYFEYKGYKVNYVSNYTDIDDKMINRAKEEEISVKELADRIIPEYEKDYFALGIKSPSVQPKATEYIDAMRELIEKLNEKAYVYVLEDGIYFDVSKFEKYGDLSGQNLQDLKMGARVDVNENKRNSYDFALWKFKKEDDEPSWKSPKIESEFFKNKLPDGRPGWHLECSAMTWKVLGEKFDIHGGGLDLKFPHHECEIAQSVGAFGEGSFARYWMHNGFINIDNEKMSKSLGNFFTLKEIFEKYDPMVVRFMFLKTHYRNPINFSDKLLEEAKAGLERIDGFFSNFNSWEDILLNQSDLEKDFRHLHISYLTEMNRVTDFMDNDFDVAGAIGVLFDLIKRVNSFKDMGILTKEDFCETRNILDDINKFLGVISYRRRDMELNKDLSNLIKQREEARKNKDFKKADEIRDELVKKGYELEDTPEGTVWKRV